MVEHIYRLLYNRRGQTGFLGTIEFRLHQKRGHYFRWYYQERLAAFLSNTLSPRVVR